LQFKAEHLEELHPAVFDPDNPWHVADEGHDEIFRETSVLAFLLF